MKYPGSLHNHTEFSNLRLRDCINKIPDLIDYAIELGHSCVAITDHEALSGHIKVEEYAAKVKKNYPDFKVIRGNEIYLVRNGLNADNFDAGVDKYFHFILLAKDAIGHKQLREISSRAWKRSFISRRMRRVPTYYADLIDVIGTNPGHVVASTACLGGWLPTQLIKYRETNDEVCLQRVVAWCDKMIEIFGKENFYLELQPSKSKDQTYVNDEIISIAAQFGYECIITTDSHYLRKEDAPIHKAYLNSQDGDREVDEFYATTYLMSDEEIRSFFKKYSNDLIERMFANTQYIADMCEEYTLFKPLKIPRLPWKFSEVSIDMKYWINNIPMLEKFWGSDEANKTLADEIIAGIKRHPECDCKEAYEEINECLKMVWESSEVNKASWASYFLNLQRIIDECWEAGSLVGCGRGSGVGFILLYLLDITQINPMQETTDTFRWRLTRIG